MHYAKKILFIRVLSYGACVGQTNQIVTQAFERARRLLRFTTMAISLSLNDPAYEWLNKLINKDGQFKDLSSKIAYNPDGLHGIPVTICI